MTNKLQAWGGAAGYPGTTQGRSATNRAEYYRRKAVRLRQMAAWEPPGEMRQRLSELARSYDQLADGLAGAFARGG